MIKKAYGGNASGSILRIALGISAFVILMSAYTVGVQANTCSEIVQVSTSPIGLSPQPTGAGTYMYGQTVTVTAQSVTGYTFQKWTENSAQVSTNMPYSYTSTCSGIRNLVAVYTPGTPPPTTTYTISVSTSPTGLNPQPTGGRTYNAGQTATVIAQPVTGYTFLKWAGDGSSLVSTSMSYSFTVTGNRNLVAVYTTTSTTTIPAAPTGTGAVAVDGTSIRISWNDNSNNEVGFEISNGDTSVKVGNTNSYTWSGLTPGQYMCFMVRAYNSAGSSAWTPYACTTPPTPPIPVPVPTPPTPVPTSLTVDKVWTMDVNNQDKTSFVPGDAIRYSAIVKNGGSSTVTATFTFLASGPKQIYSWTGQGNVVPGSPTIYSQPTIPVDAPEGTYTLTVTVSYNGQTSSKQSQFTVEPKPTPTLTVQQCSNAKFIIPHDGMMGWPYMDDNQDVKNKDGTIHRGIDIFGKAGSIVYAPYAGKVIAEAPIFRIRHSDLGVDTYYGHVINIVPKGTSVKRGDPIGTLQDQGVNTHIHFAITKLDPRYSDNNWASELIFANSLDPSPFFNAKLNFFDGTPESVDSKGNYNRPVKSWCNAAPVGIIKGVVKTQDGNKVGNAIVKIEGIDPYPSQSRITDYWMDKLNQGVYTFSNVPVREVKITASKSGVGSGSVVVTVKTSETVQAPDIILR
jgi:murein DD-endopeptidase MepM/ murein hydrolase activator NlpD